MTRREVLRAAALTAAGVGAFPLVTGCGAQRDEAGGAGGLVMSPTARRAADPAALQHGARVAQSFGTDLFRAIATDDGNVVCSPYSVAVALAMTRNGARGGTAEEMDRVLHATSAAELNAGLNALTRHIESLAHERTRPDGSERRSHPRLGELAVGAAGDAVGATLPRRVGAELWHRDAAGRLRARRRVRPAGHQQLDERPDARPDPGAARSRHPRSDTRLVLVNAIYLKAPWAVPFSKGATQDATVHPRRRLDGAGADDAVRQPQPAWPTRAAPAGRPSICRTTAAASPWPWSCPTPAGWTTSYEASTPTTGASC